jgi:hypothetical protein
LKHEEHIAMSKQTNTIAVSTIGIDTGKNTLHMIGLDEKGAVVIVQSSKIGGPLNLSKDGLYEINIHFLTHRAV